MKFVVSSAALYSHLQAIGRVINSKSTLPILDCFLFNIEGNKLSITASDNETTLDTSMEVVESEGDQQFAISSKTLLDAIKELPEQPVAFEVNAQSMEITIQYMNGKYSMMGQSADEYPMAALMGENAVSFAIDADTLLGGINRTIFATADDELRPVMNGIYFDITAENVTMVATDAHRLVKYTNNSVKTGIEANFILPKKPASLLKNLLAKEEGDVKITFGVKNARFEFDKTIVVCRRIEGRFPNYNAVIPQSNQNVVTVDRHTMVNACMRVAVFANNGTAQLRLALSENQIKISAQDIDFSTSAEEMIQCDYQGMSMAIGFKAPFLIDLLSTVGTTDVQLKLADPARAGLILPVAEEGEENVLMLLMPMLLND